MSILDRPKHEAIVQRREQRATPHGSALAAVGGPVAVPCTVRALTAAEAAELGLGTETIYRVIARDWPGDVLSLVTWQGEQWEPIGQPLRFDGSPRTQHWEVRMKQVSPDGSGV